MAEYRVVEAEEKHLRYVAANMRQPDVDEVWAVAHLTPLAALVRSALVSREPMAVLVDGCPVCIFGVSRLSPFSDVGHPWMLATPEVEQHATALLRGSVAYVRWMREVFPRLDNYVDARNEKAIGWVRWLGFEVDPPQPFGLDRLPFHRFHWKR